MFDKRVCMMSKPTEFTITELRDIISKEPKKTRKNLNKSDHRDIQNKYKKSVKDGGVPIDVKISLMAEYGISKTQILRILRKVI